MTKRLTLKKVICFALFAAFLSVMLFAAAMLSPKKVLAESEEKAYDISYEAADEFSYSRLEKTDYTDKAYCRILQPESEKYDGVYGKNAIKKTAASRFYQLYFSNAFRTDRDYEISFWAKFVSPKPTSSVKVWYVGDDNVTGKVEDLPVLTDKNGEWEKYSFSFRSNASYEKLFKLTIVCNDFSSETCVYMDEFHAYETNGKSPVICGEEFSEKEWLAEGNTEKTGFVSGSPENAIKLSGNASVTSKYLEIPSSGVLRVKFSYEISGGAKLYFGIKDVFGNAIEKTELSSAANKTTANVVSRDLEKYGFVKIFFETSGNGFAKVGLTEVIEHEHKFESGNGYPAYDPYNCTTVQYCGICEREVAFVNHEIKVVKEATCNAEGRKECVKCHNYSEVIPATGKHRYEKDVTCSPDNKREKVKCLDCGETLWLQKEHTFGYTSTGGDTHLKRCTACGYEEIAKHTVSTYSIVKNPSQTADGILSGVCGECGDYYITTLPALSDETAWNKVVTKEAGCETDGAVSYFWKEGTLTIEATVEATGHEYEEIHSIINCETEGKSVYHKCRKCGAVLESPDEIASFPPLGHLESEWITEVYPTTKSDGLQKKYCNRCKKVIEERVVPALNDTDYEKYVLEDPEKTDGYLFRYTSNIYGTFTEYEPKSNGDKILVILLPVAFVVALSVSVWLFVTISKKRKKVK